MKNGYRKEKMDSTTPSMQHAIQISLVLQKAKELGLDVITDEEKSQISEEAHKSWEEIIENVISSMGTLTDESTDDDKAAARADALAMLAAYGYDEERYTEEYLQSETSNMIYDRVMKHVADGKTVTDEDVQTYFDDLVKEDKEAYESQIDYYEYMTKYYGQKSYYTPEGYRAVNHILLPVDEDLMNNWKDLSARLEEQESAKEEEATATEAPAEGETEPTAEAEPTAEPTPTPEPVTKEMVAAAEKAILDSVQDKVDEIMAELESGTSFDDLIKEYGTDTGMENDKTRTEGYAVHKDSIVWDSNFKAGALALEKVGDISKPILSQFGVHILQYLRDIPGGAVELTDEMKEEFRTSLQSELESEALQTAIDEWMKNAVIEYTAEGEAWKLVPEEVTEEEPAAEATEAPAEETTEKPAE